MQPRFHIIGKNKNRKDQRKVNRKRVGYARGISGNEPWDNAGAFGIGFILRRYFGNRKGQEEEAGGISYLYAGLSGSGISHDDQ
jgi:hypothetical protein